MLNNQKSFHTGFIVKLSFILMSILFFNSSASFADDSDDPQALIKNTTDKMFTALNSDKEKYKKNPELIYDLVSKIVLPHFDFISMSKWVLGKHWNTSTRDQKIGFIKAYRELMIRTYSIALLEYTDSEFTYKPLRDDIASGNVTVRTLVNSPKGEPVDVNYSMHKKKKGWKIYDISVEGVSLISNNKTSFGSEIKTNGIDALIARLQSHNKGKGS
jgi:phospholipid transport system substrate-binding protein